MKRCLAVPVVLLGGLNAPVPPARATAFHEKLAAQVAALKAQVEAQSREIAQLRTDQEGAWLNQRRSEEIKALVRAVLSDADTRASLTAGGPSAGSNRKHFFLASADGSFLMNIGGLVQVRYVANFRATAAHSASLDNESGFEMRRIKIAFGGHVSDPRILYKVQLTVDRATQVVGLDDVWLGYRLADGLMVFGGEFQDRFSQEGSMSGGRTQTADRSAVDAMFANNDDYVQGIGLDWRPLEALRIGATYNDGMKSGNFSTTATNLTWNSTAAEYAVSGRVDVKLAGDFRNSADVEAWTGIDSPQVFVGGGIHYEHAKAGNAAPPEPAFIPAIPYGELTIWTADALLKYRGLGLMATGFGLYTGGSTGAEPTSNYAATVQGGYFVIPDVLEPFVRYEYIHPDPILSGAHDLHLVTAGANWFLHGHHAKFTVDVVWALNNINSASVLGTSLSSIGLLMDDPGATDQVALRAQFQLLF